MMNPQFKKMLDLQLSSNRNTDETDDEKLLQSFNPNLDDIPDIDESSESSFPLLKEGDRLNPAKELFVGHSPTHAPTKPIINSDVNDSCVSSNDFDSPCSKSKLNLDDGGTSDSSTMGDPKLKDKPKKYKIKPKIQKQNSDSSIGEKENICASKSKSQQIKNKFTPGSIEYIRENLCGAIFSGWTNERQWVETIHGYRDIIDVNECEENLNKKLNTVVNGIPGVSTGKKWINITGQSFLSIL